MFDGFPTTPLGGVYLRYIFIKYDFSWSVLKNTDIYLQWTAFEKKELTAKIRY